MSDIETHELYGDSALRAGTPDYHANDIDTNAVDTIANILHAAAATGADVDRIMEAARGHFDAERAEQDFSVVTDPLYTVSGCYTGRVVIGRVPLDSAARQVEPYGITSAEIAALPVHISVFSHDDHARGVRVTRVS